MKHYTKHFIEQIIKLLWLQFKKLIEMPGLIGRKIGMTSVFSADGKNIPCTVIEAGPCVVTQVKTVETDGYKALPFAFAVKSGSTSSTVSTFPSLMYTSWTGTPVASAAIFESVPANSSVSSLQLTVSFSPVSSLSCLFIMYDAYLSEIVFMAMSIINRGLFYQL